MESKLYDEIYSYLSTHFTPGKEFPADIVVKQILAGGYLPQRYGYQNMREMFTGLSKIMTAKNGADGKMMVVLHTPGDTVSYAETEPPAYRLRRGTGDIGLLSGKSLDDEPVRKKALPDDYKERLPENNKDADESENGFSPFFGSSAYGQSGYLSRSTSVKPRLQGYRVSDPEEPETLDEQIQFKIYQAVVMGLQLEKPLYMSTLSPVLRYAGVEHDKLGFVKSKNMLKRCAAFMDFEEVMMNGVPQTLVTVHHVPEWDEKLTDVEKHSGDVLDIAEKKKIYGVLCEHMQFGEPVHMAAFSPILKTYGFDYRSYGFQKVKELAAQLDEFLSLQEVVMNGVPQTLVTLKPLDEAALKDACVEPEKKPEDDSARPLHQAAFLPPKILGVLSRMTGQPVWACEEALEESYIAARNAGTLTVEVKYITRRGVLSTNKERAMRFPLNLQTMRGDTLIGELHETGNEDGKPWFLAWVGSPDYVKDGANEESDTERVRELTDDLTACCALSDSVVRAAAFKAILCSEPEARQMIIEDYAEAFRTGKLLKNGEEFYYPLRRTNVQGKTIYVLIAPNRIGEKAFYVRFIGTNIVFASQEDPIGKPEEKPVEEVHAVQPQTAEVSVRIDNAPLPKELEELAYLPVQTVSLLAHRCGMLFDPMMRILADSYRDCKENGKILRTPDSIRFVLLCKTLKGEEVTVHLRPSMSTERNWFLQYFDTAERKETAVTATVSEFEQFAFLGDWENQLRSLAALAAPENWEYPGELPLYGLRRYLYGVFDRIVKQDKLVYDEHKQIAAFNTGLYNRTGYDIFVLFSKNLPGSRFPWRFERFAVGRVNGSFTYQPLPPTYFENRVSPWFEAERGILQPDTQLVKDSIRILPRAFLRRCSDALETSLIEQMNLHEELTDGCYARLDACYENNPAQLEAMTEALQRAVSYALFRLKRDYAYAVPGYLPQRDQTVFMLPVTLQGSSEPDVVIAYVMEYGSYRPVKLLSMQEAYTAARFIRRSEGFWLQHPFNAAEEKEETITAKE